MIAAGRGLVAHADAIFESLRYLRPAEPVGYVGLAVARMNTGRAEEAVQLLSRDGLAACPGDPEIRTFLGLALRLAQRAGESVRVLEGVVAEHPDDAACALARKLLATP
jgi:predicted Zn-dependent protease